MNQTTACPLDCPDHCSLDVTIEAGRVLRVEAGAANPATDGFICAKVRRIARHLYGPDRLLHPAIRDGRKGSGQFRRAGWDEALDRITAELTRVRDTRGGEAILPFYYGGSNGVMTQDSTDARYFRRLGASRLLRTVCAAATGRASMGLYGKMPGVAYEDFTKAGLIVLWGANPSASGIHLVPLIQRAQKAGAKLVVLDPRRIPLARRADLHLPLRPGTDLPVALAVMRHLFETGGADHDFLAAHAHGADELRRRSAEWTFERAAAVSGVPAADLEAFARMYAAASPALVRCGWGPERNRNGGSAIAAILALPAVAGKFGVRGGGYTLANSGAWKLGSAIDDAESKGRAVNMNHLGRALLDDGAGRIDALFVYNANPLMTIPDQNQVRRGLEREDLFTVVYDQVMTDTALYADVVLPATTFLEHTEMSRGYGSYSLQVGRAVIDPVGESRPNYDVFADLVRRAGLSRPDDLVEGEALLARALERSVGAPRIQAELAADGVAMPESGAAPIQFVDVFPGTPDRKIHLCPADMDAEAPHGLYHWQPEPGDGRYPLALISPSSEKTISSTFGQLRPGPVPVELSPVDAAARGIVDGDRVRVHNELGEVLCRARVSAELGPGVVVLQKGIWARHTDNGNTSNAVSPATLTDVGAGACFNDARVEIERLG